MGMRLAMGLVLALSMMGHLAASGTYQSDESLPYLLTDDNDTVFQEEYSWAYFTDMGDEFWDGVVRMNLVVDGGFAAQSVPKPSHDWYTFEEELVILDPRAGDIYIKPEEYVDTNRDITYWLNVTFLDGSGYQEMHTLHVIGEPIIGPPLDVAGNVDIIRIYAIALFLGGTVCIGLIVDSWDLGVGGGKED